MYADLKLNNREAERAWVALDKLHTLGVVNHGDYEEIAQRIRRADELFEATATEAQRNA